MSGRYKIQFPLETGPEAHVFAVDDRRSGSRKVLTLRSQREDFFSRDDADRLFQGFHKRAAISHPLIVPIEDICWRGKRPGYISKYIHRTNLASRPETLTLRKQKRYASQLAELLLYLHQRDVLIGYLSPDKVFLQTDDDPLINPPIPSWTFPPRPRSRRYLAPELACAQHPSAEGDVYSLGALLYLIFTGVPPYHETDETALVDKQRLTSPTPLRKLNPEVPARVDAIVMQMLRSNPRSRPTLPEVSSAFVAFANPARIHSLLSRPPLTRRDHQAIEWIEKAARNHEGGKGRKWLVISGHRGTGKARLATAILNWWQLQGRGIVRLSSSESLTTNPGDSGVEFPSCILIEEVDRADLSNSNFERILSSTNHGGIVIATTERASPSEGWTRLKRSLKAEGCLDEVTLTALSDSDSKILLRGLLGRTVPADFAKVAINETGSNPWLLKEFAEHAVTSQSLLFKGAKWHYSPFIRELDSELPEAASETLKQRLAGLPAEHYSIAGVLSLLEDAISPETIRQISRRSTEKLTTSLNYLERAGIVRLEGGLINPSVRIENRWISALIAGDLDEEERREIHFKIAENERERTRGGRNGITSQRLAKHYLEAFRTEEAKQHLFPALNSLKRSFQYREAHELLDRALSLEAVDPGDRTLQTEEILLLYECGEAHKCLAKLKQALRGDISQEQRALLISIRARFASLAGQNQKAVEDLKEALGLLPSRPGSALELELRSELLGALSLKGDTIQARRLAASILNECSSRFRSTPREKAYHSLYLFSALCTRQPSSASLSWELKAARAAERIGATVRFLGRLTNISMALQRAGHWTNASRINAYCRKRAHQIGNRELELFIVTVSALAMRQRGRHRDAIDWIDQYQAENEQMNRNRHVASEMAIERIKNQIALLNLEEALNALESLDHGVLIGSDVASSRMDAILVRAAAMSSLGQTNACLDLVDPLIQDGSTWGYGRARQVRAAAQLAAGDYEEAFKEAGQALLKFPHSVPYYRVHSRLLQAEACLCNPSLGEAGPYISDAFRISNQYFFPPELVRAYTLRARDLLKKKQTRHARSHCRRALQISREVEQPLLHSEIHRTLGKVESRAGNRQTAIRHYHQALELVSEKYFGLPAKYRDRFCRTFLEPIELDLASVRARKPARSAKPLIRLRDFTSALATADEPVEIGKQFLTKLNEEIPRAAANLFLRSETNGFALLRSSGKCKRTGRRFLEILPELEPGKIITETDNGITSVGLPLWTGPVPVGLLYVEKIRSEFTELEVDFMGLMTLMTQLSVHHRQAEASFLLPPIGGGIRLGKGERIIGEHPLWLSVLEQVRKVAPSRATVLITGESGTGKDLIARAIHQLSNRADQKYFAVNCATVGADLVENELFGHIKGSYTGASDSQEGLFEATSRGTLLLDEISTMPLQIQAHLLRVLDTKTVRRIGGTREIPIDTRVLAATNEDLGALVLTRRFRHDLYHRLNVVQIGLPPLRERKSDIPLLSHYFLSLLSRENGRSVRIRSDAIRLLEEYPFPGNIRQLRNLLERLYHGVGAEEITAEAITSRIGVQHPSTLVENSQAVRIIDLLISGAATFDDAVKKPYLAREICRADVIQVITHGLKVTGGSYRKMIELFNIPPSKYRTVLRFLSNHNCKVDFRLFRKKKK